MNSFATSLVRPTSLHDLPATGMDGGRFGARLRLARAVWSCAWWLLFRPTPRWAMSGWRRFLLRLFGARIGRGAVVRPSCRIWQPWNLTMESLACLADNVDCNCAAPITLGHKSTVSQNSILSSASYEADSIELLPIVRSIRIEEHAWVASNVFVGPGVRIGAGAVVGACAVVMEDVDPWNIVGGNPLRFIKKRVLRADASDRPEAASPSF